MLTNLTGYKIREYFIQFLEIFKWMVENNIEKDYFFASHG